MVITTLNSLLLYLSAYYVQEALRYLVFEESKKTDKACASSFFVTNRFF